MKKTMLSALALSSVILLAGCNNTPAEETIVEENTPEIEYVEVNEEPEIEIIPAEEVYVEEEVIANEENAEDATTADVIVEAEPVEEVIE